MADAASRNPLGFPSVSQAHGTFVRVAESLGLHVALRVRTLEQNEVPLWSARDLRALARERAATMAFLGSLLLVVHSATLLGGRRVLVLVQQIRGTVVARCAALE